MANPFTILASYHFNHINSNSFTDSGISFSSTQKQTQLSVTPESDWGDIDSFCNKYRFYQDNPLEEILSMPSHTELMSGIDSSKISEKFNGETSSDIIKCSQKLSTYQILKMAGERFVSFSSQKIVHVKTLYTGLSLAGLSFEDKQDVKLAQLLLRAAEKVGQKEFDRAKKLLSRCQCVASNEGTSVQRVVFYFSEALLERINKETLNSEEFKGSVINEACVKRNVQAFAAMHQKLPFFQVIHFTAVQTILDNIETKSKVLHLIDFQILTGTHWAAFMQAITEHEIGHLKITAVETVDNRGAEKTGKFLQSFASYLNLSFSYKVVSLSDIKDLKEEHLETQPDENTAIFFHFMLRSLITKPICMKNLMRITQKIKPSIMVVGEVEANHNSPSFANRFVEALFYYGGLFDSLEESMQRDDRDRMVIESGTFLEGIHNIVVREGNERVSRSVSISVWRAFFGKFGMMELELSTTAMLQAGLIVNKFDCGEYCTLDVSSKCLIMGWKGTPLFSVSAWKFH
ncbi:hypothetical protein BUALT_Bualt02G0242300 [Buddleja alternifolia]|uniref:DELLA protein RGL2 n=1 Tax=Buddleja alternifolia TaxID=168488 RepID=A0AAV6Y418_9LAMI|nr:hypothetical protein BUALT_Bualt02G0242300 [Buddleja alternifolia]